MKGLIEAINAENLKAEVPSFEVGDTVKVGYKIIEGGKERVQTFGNVYPFTSLNSITVMLE